MFNRKLSVVSIVLWGLIQIGTLCRANVVPNAFFQDNMMLQRDKPVAVWGRAEPGESVTVHIAGVTNTATAASDGKWLLYLDPVSADGIAHTLTIRGNNNTNTFSNILYGDIYLGSGQSNMSLLVRDLAADLDAALRGANMPRIRLFQVPAFPSTTLKEEVGGKWELCNTESAHGFSALLYFFGRDLYQNSGVPIGLINASFGGSYIHAWHPNLPDVEYSSVCYNSMIAPLMPFTLNGILWYQGESDAGSRERSGLWSQRYTELITLWRQGFNQPDLPFFCTQLANYEWLYMATLRDGQYRSMHLTNSGCTTAVDIGDTNDIHPKTKEILGPRFGLWVRKFLYGEELPFTGPLWENAALVDSAIEVTFAHVGSGLIAKDGSLEAFEIAGSDEEYVAAEASIISSNTIQISAASVTNPVWVRYAWSSDPAITLYGGDELPALPFRAEAGTTGPMPSFQPTLINTNPPPPPLPSKPYTWGSAVVDLTLNENSGSTATDHSGFQNHGTISGATWSPGYEGSSLSFTSEHDYVTIPFSPSLNIDTFTAAAWIKPNINGSYMNIISCLRRTFGWKFIINRGSSVLGFAWFDEASSTDIITGITPLTSNAWSHVAVTVENGRTVSFYLNGKLEAEATMTSRFSRGDTALTIASTGTGWYGGVFKGEIDNLFLFDEVLTASQVADLAEGIRPVPVHLTMNKRSDFLEISATNLSVHAVNRLQTSTNLTEGWSDHCLFTGISATNWSLPTTLPHQLFRIKAE
jgi:sialate O-acetylesterase